LDFAPILNPTERPLKCQGWTALSESRIGYGVKPDSAGLESRASLLYNKHVCALESSCHSE
jgi:hypothetical protein